MLWLFFCDSIGFWQNAATGTALLNVTRDQQIMNCCFCVFHLLHPNVLHLHLYSIAQNQQNSNVTVEAQQEWIHLFANSQQTLLVVSKGNIHEVLGRLRTILIHFLEREQQISRWILLQCIRRLLTDSEIVVFCCLGRNRFSIHYRKWIMETD